MRQDRASLLDLPVELPSGEFALDDTVMMTLPDGWSIVSGGFLQPPPIQGVASFAELTDGEVVLTVAAREYLHGAERLLDEITGHDVRADDVSIANVELQLVPVWRGRAAFVVDAYAAYFVVALVAEHPTNHATRAFGVEVVAAGPPAAVAARIATLSSMVSTLDLIGAP